MNRIILAIGIAFSINFSSNAQSNDLVAVLLNPENGIENAVVYSDEDDTSVYAYSEDSDSDQTKSKTDGKTKRTTTTRTRSTSNGKTNTATSAYGRETASSPDKTSLAVYEFFGDKYKRVDGCVLSLVEGEHSYYCGLVTSNQDVMKKMRQFVNEDKKKCKSVNTTFRPKQDVMVLSFDNYTIGFTDNFNSCEIYLTYSTISTHRKI